ncbi:MAG: hypothetical protein FGM37_09210 [Phycisphaerales bacterium]|nr:hypothetical protein [Phycisphaerales bacterium]
MDALDRRRRRQAIRRRTRLAGLAVLVLAVATWSVIPQPASVPPATIAQRLGADIRELSDDELIELLESAGYQVELIRTPTRVLVRLNEGPLIGFTP